MSSDRRLISIIVPVYNEERNLSELYAQLQVVLAKLEYDFELIFVNDASTDASQTALERLASQDKRVRVLEFVRNFGKEAATTAGLNHAKGEACLMIDADLQHPVELIPQFVSKWEAGAEVVVGVRIANKGEGLVKQVGSYWFYKIINAIGHTKLIPNETDFRLLDREVVDAFNCLSEQNRITRGLVDWLGYRQDRVDFTAHAREHGEAGYSLIKLIKLAFNSFISLSLFPLRLAGYLGIILTSIAGLLGVIVILFKYIIVTDWGQSITGTGMLTVFILFFVGIILICLGLIALYIANIHTEVINRPLYLIRQGRGKRHG